VPRVLSALPWEVKNPHRVPRRTFLPADALDVRVAANGQAMASAQTAAFEDLATIGRGHALAEAMHAHAAADLGLISTLPFHILIKTRSKLHTADFRWGLLGRSAIITEGMRFGQTINWLFWSPQEDGTARA
jgi:hypothetical protein